MSDDERVIVAYCLCGLNSLEIALETGFDHEEVKEILEELIPVLDFYYDENGTPHVKGGGLNIEI